MTKFKKKVYASTYKNRTQQNPKTKQTRKHKINTYITKLKQLRHEVFSFFINYTINMTGTKTWHMIRCITHVSHVLVILQVIKVTIDTWLSKNKINMSLNISVIVLVTNDQE